jgi:hypothetical protein
VTLAAQLRSPVGIGRAESAEEPTAARASTAERLAPLVASPLEARAGVLVAARADG